MSKRRCLIKTSDIRGFAIIQARSGMPIFKLEVHLLNDDVILIMAGTEQECCERLRRIQKENHMPLDVISPESKNVYAGVFHRSDKAEQNY